MQRLLLPLLLVGIAIAAFFALRGNEPGDVVPPPGVAPAATGPAATVHAEAPEPGALTAADDPQRRAIAGGGESGTRATRLRIRGRFEPDPRLSLADAVVRIVDRDVTAVSTGGSPFGFGYPGLVPLDPGAKERARAVVRADGSFEVDVLEIGRAPTLTVQLVHDHYFLPTVPEIPAGGANTEQDLGSLRPILGGLIVGRLVGFDRPTDTDVLLVAETDMTAPARDPQLFGAQMALGLRPPEHATSEGLFKLRAIAPNPSTHVRAERADQIGHSAHFAVSPGETREVTVHAQQAATVVVRVRDPDGSSVADANVTVSTTAGVFTGRRASSRRGTTDAEGRVRLQGLATGEVRVEVNGTDFAPLRERRTLNPGEQEFTVTLDLGASVQGTIEDDQGTKVAGARIASQASMSVPMFGDMTTMVGADMLAAAAAHARCRSDAEGRFTLGGLQRDATVTLIVAHDDYAPKVQSSVKAGSRDLRVVLPRRAAVSGRVVDGATRQPLVAFDVELLSSGMMGIEIPIRTERVRDAADGRFTLRLSPGRVGLRFGAPGFGSLDHPIQPTAGAELDLGDVVLQPSCSIAGRVLDDLGQPVVGARVRIRRGGMQDHPMYAQMGANRATATAGPGGEFSLREVTPGKVRLLASHRDFATCESTRLEVAPGHAQRDVVVTLDHGGEIAGRLVLASGARIADWDIYAGEMRGGSVQAADLDADGTFRVKNLTPGAYNVQAINSKGFSGAMQDSGIGDRDGPDMTSLMKSIARHMVQAQCQVRKGEVTQIDLDASTLAAGGATLVVSVLLGDQPITDSFLEVRSAGEGGRIVAIENGKAEVAGLKPGPVSLQVRTGMGFSPVGDAQTTTIDKAGGKHAFELHLPGGVLAGRVVDSDSGEGLRGVCVRARRVDAVATAATELGFAMTDGNGSFHLRGLQAGTYNVVADELLSGNPERTSSRIDGLTLGASERRENLVLRARRGAQATVSVRDGSGLPLRHAMVMLVDADGQPAATMPIAITDADGRADLAGVPDGPVRAVARVAHLAPGTSDLLQASSGRELRLDVTLNPGTSVSLHVENARGEPLAGSRVAIKLGDGPWLSAQLLGITMGAADIDLGALPPGTVRLRIDHPTAGTFEAERTVPPGRRATLTVTAPR